MTGSRIDPILYWNCPECDGIHRENLPFAVPKGEAFDWHKHSVVVPLLKCHED
jgi:hypothetical protein